jgi:hypothetical protein
MLFGRSRQRVRSSRSWATWFVLLRLATLIFSLQFSGLIHGVSDIACSLMGVASEHEQCPVDRPCDECPLGCPNCHCPAPVRLGGWTPSVVVSTDSAARAQPLQGLYETQAPPGPDLPSIFRPPRSEHRA